MKSNVLRLLSRVEEVPSIASAWQLSKANATSGSVVKIF